MKDSGSYLNPRVAQAIKRLDLKAQFIVKGFMHGLHASPLQGFSVEFSEHRKYERGDDPKDIDWRLYARVDKYYVRKYESETNMTGWLVVDSSGSMGRRAGAVESAPCKGKEESVSKFDYAISLCAALSYLMTHRQDPVGLVAFDSKLRRSIAPSSKRSQFGTILSTLAQLQPEGVTNVAQSLTQLAGMLKRASLVMIFSDLLGDPQETLRAVARLRGAGHDVIIFHILDEAEAKFPFKGPVRLIDPETNERVEVDADAIRGDYLKALDEFRQTLRKEASRAKFDVVELDTSMPFDKALLSYLVARSHRR